MKKDLYGRLIHQASTLVLGLFISSAAIAKTSQGIIAGGYISEDGSAEIAVTNEGRAAVVTVAARVVSTGSVVSNPGAGVGGADESILENTTLGMSAFGFTVSSATNYRLADDFTLTKAERINTVTVYAYQTTAPTMPSPITAATVRIWDGVPGAVGSSVIFGDTATNRLASSSWFNTYRVTEADSGVGVNRAIMANVLTINTVLPAGTYWLDWDLTGTTGLVFAPPIAITGQTTTGNALQSSNSGVIFNAATDGATDTPQGFPITMDLDAISVPVFTPLGLIMMVSGLVWFGRRRKLKLD